MIEVKSVSKTYIMGKEKVTALNDVSLKIKKGEFVAIIGPSGSGKSTLMHIVGGLDSPTMGSVMIEGKDIGKLKDKFLENKEVAYLCQKLATIDCSIPDIKLPEYSLFTLTEESLNFLKKLDIKHI